MSSVTDVYDALEEYLALNGYPPTVRDLAVAAGRSVSTTHAALDRLRVAGSIEFGPRRSAMQVKLTDPVLARQPRRGVT